MSHQQQQPPPPPQPHQLWHPWQQQQQQQQTPKPPQPSPPPPRDAIRRRGRKKGEPENSPPPPPPQLPTLHPQTAGPSNQYGGVGSQGSSYSPSGSGSDEPSDIPGNIAPENFEEVETAFHGRLKTYRLRDEAPSRLTIPEFLTQLFEDLVKLMHRILEHVTAVKTNLWLDCEFTNVHDQTCQRAFKTKNVAVLRSTDIDELCSNLFQKLVDEKEVCERTGSGWTFTLLLSFKTSANFLILSLDI
ncbi:uncharacterized protein LOC128982110 [Macrosteles quadrilineatus]|uniref:uncharacterized protein LOC128982110 n=1 Tax=Macrosteles quadrilineatus TaxID=74068 RepID=UPI0023E24798|nr:uncharacterized protein LOC128982110 [Macrosteles quadrilineatus]